MPFEIGPGFKISVKGYNIFKRQEPQRSCYIWLEGEKPLLVTHISTQIADETARSVDKAEINKAYKFGGEQIPFTLEEITQIRHFGDPGIRIIGFKPQSLLPIWANTRPSILIYPSEEDYVGSTRVFSALQQKLLKDNKMALAWFIPRRNASPTIAAIVPGIEKRDENGAQFIPPGMWICPLPFADDIRQNPETSVIPAPDPLIDRMREVVQQLQLPKAVYDPRKYPNPALQWHYRILQALALDEDIPDKPEDKTIPKYKQIDKRAGPLAIDWGHELHKQFQEWQSGHGSAVEATPNKRPAQDEIAVRGTKKAKTTDVEGAVDDAAMKKAFEKQTVNKVSDTILSYHDFLIGNKLMCYHR